MKTELERYKEAERILRQHIAAQCALGHLTGGAGVEAERILELARTTVAPEPEVEEVEVERFLVFYMDGSVSHALTRDGLRGFDCKSGTLKRVAHVVTRPKPQRVERSGKLSLFSDGSYCLEPGHGFSTRIDRDGTFTWTEEP